MRWFGSVAVAGASFVLSFLVIEIGLRALGYPATASTASRSSATRNSRECTSRVRSRASFGSAD